MDIYGKSVLRWFAALPLPWANPNVFESAFKKAFLLTSPLPPTK